MSINTAVPPPYRSHTEEASTEKLLLQTQIHQLFAVMM
jgi:hypothetical protein